VDQHSKPRGRFGCNPDDAFMMLVEARASEGERLRVIFRGMPDLGGAEPPQIRGQSEVCEEGFGPHRVHFAVPEETEGDYQMAHAYFTNGETITGAVRDDLDDVWLSVPPTGNEDNSTVIRLRRDEESAPSPRP
jgi:hypothetical protein